MAESAALLTDSGNYAVVQLPRRKFPGVVFQGDSTRNILVQLGRIQLLQGNTVTTSLMPKSMTFRSFSRASKENLKRFVRLVGLNFRTRPTRDERSNQQQQDEGSVA